MFDIFIGSMKEERQKRWNDYFDWSSWNWLFNQINVNFTLPIEIDTFSREGKGMGKNSDNINLFLNDETRIESESRIEIIFDEKRPKTWKEEEEGKKFQRKSCDRFCRW